MRDNINNPSSCTTTTEAVVQEIMISMRKEELRNERAESSTTCQYQDVPIIVVDSLLSSSSNDSNFEAADDEYCEPIRIDASDISILSGDSSEWSESDFHWVLDQSEIIPLKLSIDPDEVVRTCPQRKPTVTVGGRSGSRANRILSIQPSTPPSNPTSRKQRRTLELFQQRAKLLLELPAGHGVLV